MHWGLTTFERKRIERIALDHPYFDTHAPLLTKKEIAAIVKEGSHKSGYQVIAEVMAELGITYVPAKRKKRSFREALRDMSFIPSFRRSVALGLLCLLLVLFMTFTAPGRAFAEEVYSIIIDFVDGVFKSHNSIPSQNNNAPDFSSIPNGLETPKALSLQIGAPIIISNDELISFTYASLADEFLFINSQYLSISGKEYSVNQEVYGHNVMWGSGIDAIETLQEVETAFGIMLFIGRSSDGGFFAMGACPEYSITISSTQMTIDDIVEIAESIDIQ